MHAVYLSEDGRLRRQKTICEFKTLAQPVLGIQYIILRLLDALFNKPRLSGQTVEADREISDLLKHLIIRNLKDTRL